MKHISCMDVQVGRAVLCAPLGNRFTAAGTGLPALRGHSFQ
jgi:hypothetical protein